MPSVPEVESTATHQNTALKLRYAKRAIRPHKHRYSGTAAPIERLHVRVNDDRPLQSLARSNANDGPNGGNGGQDFIEYVVRKIRLSKAHFSRPRQAI